MSRLNVKKTNVFIICKYLDEMILRCTKIAELAVFVMVPPDAEF